MQSRPPGVWPHGVWPWPHWWREEDWLVQHMTLIKQGRDSLHNCSKAGSSTLHRKIMQSDHMILVLDSIKNYVMSCYVDQTMAYHGGLQAKTLPLSCSRSPTKPAVGLHVNVLEKKHYISCLFHNSVKIPPRLVGCD